MQAYCCISTLCRQIYTSIITTTTTTTTTLGRQLGIISLPKGDADHQSEAPKGTPGGPVSQRRTAKQRKSILASPTLDRSFHTETTSMHPRNNYAVQPDASLIIESVFLGSEGLNPAFDPRILLIRAGDIEVNPGPKLQIRFCSICQQEDPFRPPRNHVTM